MILSSSSAEFKSRQKYLKTPKKSGKIQNKAEATPKAQYTIFPAILCNTLETKETIRQQKTKTSPATADLSHLPFKAVFAVIFTTELLAVIQSLLNAIK